ncbi:hypothetical protein Baya_6476 [Bagarius yarrelli]|uniref:Uncharacterized protein n=1 Tax=Bagarius yarrelli TaxID=175774 RepID=A0A556U0D5_BAGYA|nr:hypothetical protein Baya_6476 [Bagarius yarrelli]
MRMVCESLGRDEEQRPCCLAQVVLMCHSCDKGLRWFPDELLSYELSALYADGQIRAKRSSRVYVYPVLPARPQHPAHIRSSGFLPTSCKSPPCEGATQLYGWRKFSAEGSIPFEIKPHILCTNLDMPENFTSPPARMKES